MTTQNIVSAKARMSKTRAYSSDPKIRQRAHAERMLARADRRSHQALKLVEKWKATLADLDREGVASKAGETLG
jgi:hypothetical protein